MSRILIEYPPEWNAYLDELVFRYQKGNVDAAKELLDAFKWYMKKFLRILQEGELNLADRDCRRFISKFIAEPRIRQLLKWSHHSSEVVGQAHRSAGLLALSCQAFSGEDLKQELNLALLTLAKRYHKRGEKSWFSGYVIGTYFHEVHRRIEALIKDPITMASVIPFSDEAYSDPESIQEYEAVTLNEKLAVTDQEELNVNWVHGITCGDEFSMLNKLERLILKLYYVDGMTDQEIAGKLGVTRVTAHHRRHGAVEKVRFYIEHQERYDEAVQEWLKERDARGNHAMS